MNKTDVFKPVISVNYHGFLLKTIEIITFKMITLNQTNKKILCIIKCFIKSFFNVCLKFILTR